MSFNLLLFCLLRLARGRLSSECIWQVLAHPGQEKHGSYKADT
jgi:hypothetical protein